MKIHNNTKTTLVLSGAVMVAGDVDGCGCTLKPGESIPLDEHFEHWEIRELFY